MTARAIVGGVEFAVGGWGAYEAERRRARWETGSVPARERYPGRSYILGGDVAASLMARPGGALRRAGVRLADALAALEARQCDTAAWNTLTIPPTPQADLRDLAGTDPAAMVELGREAQELAAALAPSAVLEPLPPVTAAPPTRPAATADDNAVLKLEADTIPYVEQLEVLQAALASRLEAVTRIVSASCPPPEPPAAKTSMAFADVAKAAAAKATMAEGGAKVGAAKASMAERGGDPKKPASAKTRGEEVDAAARDTATLELLKQEISGLGSLSWKGQAFDIVEGKIRVTDFGDGVYRGASNRKDPARATLLTPRNVERAAFQTSGRVYAWIILDSPEALYAIRADSHDGRISSVREGAILNWLKSHLRGSPPHKVNRDHYVEFLRGLKMDVRILAARDTEARFDLDDQKSQADLAREIKTIQAMTPAELLALDWTEYDQVVGDAVQNHEAEVAGDVIIEGGRIRVPKLRPGILFMSRPHVRSSVTFHTHPWARFVGHHVEPPSDQDVSVTLMLCAEQLLAWSFVAAPEGTYIMRPSRALAEAHRLDPHCINDLVLATYREYKHCHDSVAACAEQTVRALNEAGLVAFLRPTPGAALFPRPDLFTIANSQTRAASRAADAEAAALTPAQLFALDWSAVDAIAATEAVRTDQLWLEVRIGGQKARARDGHILKNLDDPQAYPRWENHSAPILTVYFADDSRLPSAIPHGAIHAADGWAWVVFLTPLRLAVFRAGPAGVEIHNAMRVRPGEPKQLR